MLVYKRIVEDCEKDAEFCQTFYRTQNIETETVLCQKSKAVTCDEEVAKNATLSLNVTKICHENRVALCSTKPETITITEKRQKCHGDDRTSGPGIEKVTKICITHTNGSWSCKDIISPNEVQK